jgi:serine/threonine-protein kinase
LQRDQPLAVARAVRLAGQIAEGLGIAHAHGLVHGGLRPENIFVQADGDEETVQLTGWEVAGLETGQVGAAPGQLDLAPGTAEYLAPEQASGEPPTCQSDVYALGVLVYEMLTGFVPFTAPTPEEVLAKHRWDRPVPPRALRADIPAVLQTAVCQALEKRAEHRQQHVRDVANEFLYELALDPDDDEADEDGPLTRLWARLAHRTAPAATSARARWISLALSAALILSAVTALMVTGARREVPTGLGRAGGVSNPVTRSSAAPVAPRVAPPTQPAEPEKPPVVEASAPERPVEPAPQPPQPTINPVEPPATPATSRGCWTRASRRSLTSRRCANRCSRHATWFTSGPRSWTGPTTRRGNSPRRFRR